MKYAISIVLGLLTGAALFGAGFYFNPFVGQPSVSPLAVTTERVVDLSFSAVPADAILYTDHGESIVAPRPERVAELWEPAVHDTNVFVTALQDSRGGTAGIGIKMRSKSEATALIRGEALANSVWHIYLPGQGTMMIDQTENYWSYIRDVMIPARWSSGDNWRGTFHRVMTNGPGSLGTARVSGGSGDLAGVTTESVESLTAAGYSAATGPVAMEGGLTIAIPQQRVASEP
ncbi:MAG: hypothetical protein KJO82_04790 [Gammaproteobacteria bacterium]|nr:hypothetical protein [Gammaproteobacteria bacterium]